MPALPAEEYGLDEFCIINVKIFMCGQGENHDK
jgi:hypothetical protein